MLKSYLNQNATLRVYGGADDNNEIIYTNTNIKCRYEKHLKRFLMEHGQITESVARVFMLTKPSVRDVIVYNEVSYEIIDVSDMVDFSGKVVGYEVLLK
jgi:hypothetical protein